MNEKGDLGKGLVYFRLCCFRFFIAFPLAEMSLMGEIRESSAHPTMSLTFDDIRVTVDGAESVEGSSRLTSLIGAAPRQENNILNGASGVLNSGEVYAIMGPSGAGKTSLLDTLAGRKTVGNITGSILINGYPMSQSSIRHLSAYVSQEDVLLATLTVREVMCKVLPCFLGSRYFSC
jgi:ABC-type multidrug transport system ATPase subunit